MTVWYCNQQCVVVLWIAYQICEQQNNVIAGIDYLMELLLLMKTSNKDLATEHIESNTDLITAQLV